MGRGAAADGAAHREVAELDTEEHLELGDVSTGGWDRSQLRSGHAETIGRRPTMEDAVATIHRFRGKLDEDYWGLFDGHGGKTVATWLAERLHGYLATTVSALAGKRTNEAVRSSIDEAFRAASAALRKELPVSSRMGSTAVVAVLLQRTLHIANCGDSRAVLCNAGNAHRLSFDHKPELACERERIKEAGGHVYQTHPLGPARVDGVLSVSRSFGDFLLSPKVTWHPYHAERRLTAADEFVVLGCDGVWDVLDDQTAVDIGRKALDAGKPPKVAARQIMNASLQRGSTDNVSVVVVQFNKPLKTTSPNDDLLAAMEAAISGGGTAASSPQQAAQADRFGDHMSGRGILTRLNPSPRRAGRTHREFTTRSPRRGTTRAPAVSSTGSGGAMSYGPADRRRQQRTADAERFSKVSMEQHARSTGHTTAILTSEDSEVSATDSDESVDSSDEDLGGMWDGVHTPSKEVVKGAVESGAVVMARPLLNTITPADEKQAARGAGRVTGRAQSCNVTPVGTISEHSYRVLTQHTTTSRGVMAGASASISNASSAGVAAMVMGDVLGGSQSSGSASASIVGAGYVARANRFA